MVQMVRKRIIVKGNVQRVSYRAYVLQCASILEVAGLVRNLPDGTVEIYCEGSEGSLKKLIKALDVHGDEGNPLEMNVKKISIFKETDNSYRMGKVPRTYGKFMIDYGRKVNAKEREHLEREELTLVAGQLINKNLGKIDERLGSGFKDIGKRMDGMVLGVTDSGKRIDGVGHNVKDMHNDMNERFDELDNKYHVISEALLAHTKAIEALVEDYISEKRKKKDQSAGQN